MFAPCNSKCSGNCSGLDKFLPVCGSGQIYFNPCYAGCSNAAQSEESKQAKHMNYTGCDCAGGSIVSTNMEGCNKYCKYFPGFMVSLFVTIWFTCMSAMPCIACILRFVEPENKSLSMGIANIIVRYKLWLHIF